MMATLLLFYKDGTTAAEISDGTWKSAVLHPTERDLSMGPPVSHPVDQGPSAGPPEGWQKRDFDDSAWKHAVAWAQQKGPEETPVLNPWISDSVKTLRKTFKCEQPIKSARLYATALGTYEMFLNGPPVSAPCDVWMAPGWTDYRERVLYQTYDVTRLVRSGQNSMTALLAPGWYSTPLEWLQQPNNYGRHSAGVAGAIANRARRRKCGVGGNGPSWEANASYILHSELYDGETQDLRVGSLARILQTFTSIAGNR